MSQNKHLSGHLEHLCFFNYFKELFLLLFAGFVESTFGHRKKLIDPDSFLPLGEKRFLSKKTVVLKKID